MQFLKPDYSERIICIKKTDRQKGEAFGQDVKRRHEQLISEIEKRPTDGWQSTHVQRLLPRPEGSLATARETRGAAT